MRNICCGSAVARLLILVSSGPVGAQHANEWSIGLTPLIWQVREEILTGKLFSSFGILVRQEWNGKSPCGTALPCAAGLILTVVNKRKSYSCVRVTGRNSYYHHP